LTTTYSEQLKPLPRSTWRSGSLAVLRRKFRILNVQIRIKLPPSFDPHQSIYSDEGQTPLFLWQAANGSKRQLGNLFTLVTRPLSTFMSSACSCLSSLLRSRSLCSLLRDNTTNGCLGDYLERPCQSEYYQDYYNLVLESKLVPTSLNTGNR